MFCENCGERLPNDARFCTNCGHKVQVITRPTPNIEVETNPQESALAEEVLAALQEEEANRTQTSLANEQEQPAEEVTENTEQEQPEEEVTESAKEAEEEQPEEEVTESAEEPEQEQPAEEVAESTEEAEEEKTEEEATESTEEVEQSEDEHIEDDLSETDHWQQLLQEQQLANDIDKSLQEQQLADEVEQALLNSNEMKQSLNDDTWTPGVMQPQGNMYGFNEREQIQNGYNQGMPMNNGMQPNMNGMPMNNGVQPNMNGMPMNNGIPNQQWNTQQGFVPNGQSGNPQVGAPTGQTTHNKVKKKRKKLHILSKIAILEWVAVVVLLVGSYMMAQKYFSAEQSAKQYFTALMSGKVSDAYQFIDVSADGMVNETNFKTVVAQQGCKKISGYDIMRDVEKNDHMHEITIRYNVKDSKEDFYYTICMEKTGKKRFYLFDQWKVNVGDVVAQKVKVTVPNGTKVSINGKELSAEWKKVQENTDCYTIPKMFYGTYEAKATHPIYEDETFTFSVNGEESTGELTGFSKVKEEALQKVTEQAMNDFKVYWNGMTKKTGFAQLQNLSQLSEENYSSEDDYANMLSRMASSRTEGIVALTFDEMNVKAVTVNDSDGQQVQVEFSSDMAYTFNTYDFWDGKLKMERRTDYYQGTITYVYKDGKWLQDTSNLGFYVY